MENDILMMMQSGIETEGSRMAHEMVPTGGGMSSKNSEKSYKKLFNGTATKREKIKAATSRLAVVMDKAIKAEALSAWAQSMESFSTEELAQAFTAAEATLEAWPTPAKVIRLIFESEFTADYTWMLEALRRHKPEWKAVGPSYKPARRIPGGTPEDVYPREIDHPGYPLPEIPQRLKRALEVYAHGAVSDGLELLYRHPMCRGYMWEPAESMRIQSQIDRDFKAAWQQARNEEL
jgi:hypothetical protein